SGSFTNYLLDRYGAEKFLRVYKERNFDAIYSEPLTKLESDWKEKLAGMQTPMDHYDSLRILYYFKRTSILREPCLRRIGKMIKRADEAFLEKKYALADSLYAIVERESGRIKAIRGRVLCQLHLGKPDAALVILDTTSSANETSNLAALHILRGDVMVLAKGEIAKATSEWNEAMRLELGDGYFTAAFMRLSFFGETEDVAGVQKILKDLYGVEEAKDKYKLVFAIEPALAQPSVSFYKARLYLYVSYIERTGKLSAAYRIWKEGEKAIYDYYSSLGNRIEPAPEELLFDRLMAHKYSQYSEAFGAWDHSSRSTTLPP
ncbi:MAG: hypothetical protein Q8919_00235, partial [Bacteroidota bacterium]|nr:hypothetical protein [Bacteroidota bacterium]